MAACPVVSAATLAGRSDVLSYGLAEGRQCATWTCPQVAADRRSCRFARGRARCLHGFRTPPWQRCCDRPGSDLLWARPPAGGWTRPWPNVLELARVLRPGSWTLVGGLMAQVHAMSHGIEAMRPTVDIDLLLHVEMITGVAADTASALERLGYTLRDPFDRKVVVYRFERGSDRADVMSPDHARPPATMRRRPMFVVEGGKQAVDRAIALVLHDGDVTAELSVPDELGALVLKGAAYLADFRDRGRHRHARREVPIPPFLIDELKHTSPARHRPSWCSPAVGPAGHYERPCSAVRPSTRPPR